MNLFLKSCLYEDVKFSTLQESSAEIHKMLKAFSLDDDIHNNRRGENNECCIFVVTEEQLRKTNTF